MKNKLFKKTLLSAAVTTVLSLFTSSLSPASAYYYDNPDEVYYDLARLAYKVTGTKSVDQNTIHTELNKNHPDGKFYVIDSIDTTNSTNHPASKTPSGYTQELANTGFSAYATVIPGSRKLFISFTGSQNQYDFNTARNILEGDIPGQLYQAQLYANYIYHNYPSYQDYKWYFTGHSLGGWLATKLYLDIRSANWINSTTKFKYGGAFGKGTKTIDGVYTFNPLPIKKGGNLPDTQWYANRNSGIYDEYIKNLYIENEWLNSVYDMHNGAINDGQFLDYFGTKGAVKTGIFHYSTTSYVRKYYPGHNVAEYYAYTYYSGPVDAHGIGNFSDIVR